jgi:hypothetical protein
MEGDIFRALRELSRRPEFAEIHRLLGRFLDSQLRFVSALSALTGSRDAGTDALIYTCAGKRERT